MNTLKQLIENYLLWADLTLSTILGGYPRDTVSTRLARARDAGSWKACIVCKILSKAFFWMNRDHCTWAETGSDSIGAEVWHWGSVK